MSNVSRMVVRLASVVAVVALGLTVAGAPALAHNALVSSSPGNKKKYDKAPKQVKLKFLADLDPATTKFEVVDDEGNDATAGKPKFNKNAVAVKFKATKAGVYTASYELVSDDSHPIKGKVTFTLNDKAVEGIEPSPTPTPSPTPSETPPPPGADRLVASGQVTDAASADQGFNFWWLVGGGALVILLGLMEAGRRARKES